MYLLRSSRRVVVLPCALVGTRSLFLHQVSSNRDFKRRRGIFEDAKTTKQNVWFGCQVQELLGSWRRMWRSKTKRQNVQAKGIQEDWKPGLCRPISSCTPGASILLLLLEEEETGRHSLGSRVVSFYRSRAFRRPGCRNCSECPMRT